MGRLGARRSAAIERECKHRKSAAERECSDLEEEYSELPQTGRWTLLSRSSKTVSARRNQVKGSGAACGAISTSDTASAPITAGPTPRMKALSHCRSFILLSNGRIESIMVRCH